MLLNGSEAAVRSLGAIAVARRKADRQRRNCRQDHCGTPAAAARAFEIGQTKHRVVQKTNNL